MNKQDILNQLMNGFYKGEEFARDYFPIPKKLEMQVQTVMAKPDGTFFTYATDHGVDNVCKVAPNQITTAILISSTRGKIGRINYHVGVHPKMRKIIEIRLKEFDRLTDLNIQRYFYLHGIHEGLESTVKVVLEMNEVDSELVGELGCYAIAIKNANLAFVNEVRITPSSEHMLGLHNLNEAEEKMIEETFQHMNRYRTARRHLEHLFEEHEGDFGKIAAQIASQSIARPIIERIDED